MKYITEEKANFSFVVFWSKQSTDCKGFINFPNNREQLVYCKCKKNIKIKKNKRRILLISIIEK